MKTGRLSLLVCLLSVMLLLPLTVVPNAIYEEKIKDVSTYNTVVSQPALHGFDETITDLGGDTIFDIKAFNKSQKLMKLIAQDFGVDLKLTRFNSLLHIK